MSFAPNVYTLSAVNNSFTHLPGSWSALVLGIIDLHWIRAVVIFWPKYRLAHPENDLFSLSNNIFSGSKYPKNISFNFEKRSTGSEYPKMFYFILKKKHCSCPSMLFTKVNLTCLGCFDPFDIIFCSTNKQFLG